MNTFFIIIFLLSIPSLIVGLIKPSIFKLHTRKSAGLLLGGIMVSSFILFGVTSTPPEEIAKPAVEQNNKVVEVVATTTKEKEIVATTTKPVTVTNKVATTQPVVTAPKIDSQYTYYSVTEVVDGDTVKVNINGTIETLRLIGLDTPETVDPRKPVQCFGKEASNKGKELLTRKKVRLEKDPTQGDKDKYGRTLAYIYTESGIFYNKYMIEQGYAHEYTYNSAYKYQVEFKQAQKTAEANKVGLWSPSTCNGVTTSALKTTQTSPTITQGSGKYYTSSAGTKYYPESCIAWQSLSKANLKSFNTLDELLTAYPNRTLADTCK
jgi:micrococcal nuclease